MIGIEVLILSFGEKDLRESVSLSCGWPTSHIYQSSLHYIVYASLCFVDGRYRDVCVVTDVLDGQTVKFFAVLFSDIFMVFCDIDISDELLQMLHVFFHRFWMRPKLYILDDQDVSFYRNLSAKLDLEVMSRD